MTLVAFSAVIEALTGLVLMVQPSLLARLLLGAELSQPGQAVGRVAGFALLSLAWACWPRRGSANSSDAGPAALLIYNLLTALFLAYLGIGGGLAGILLWPAVLLHAVLSILFAGERFFK